MSIAEAKSLLYIDVDWMEACAHCYKTLLLVETCRDMGQQTKVGRVLQELARDANKPAAIVFYKTSPTVTFQTMAGKFPDIVSFRVRRIHPLPETEHVYSPEEWALTLLKIRRKHSSEEREECAARFRRWSEGVA